MVSLDNELNDFENLKCLFWAAVMSNAGTLEIKDHWIETYWKNNPRITRINNTRDFKVIFHADYRPK